MINAHTKLCCIIGNPVEHSLSPQIHNASYQALGLNYAYLAFKVSDLQNALRGIKSLGIRGISVTIPHKVAIMKYLDQIDNNALKIGAVNTIINDHGKLKGYNTDYLGAMKALKEKTSLSGKKVCVIGAGGAARSIIVGLLQEKAYITIINRTLTKAEKLAKEFSLKKYFSLADIGIIKNCEIIIQTTSVGMLPNINETLVPKKFLKKGQIVFDIVYNPKETKLIKEARKIGCTIIHGYKMLLYQAVAQFKLFTGVNAPLEVMEKRLLKLSGLKAGESLISNSFNPSEAEKLVHSFAAQ